MVNRLFATKSLEMLHKEMGEDEGRLRRVLGPIGLTSLGVGAIIGAGIFVMTGRVAANDSGPAIVLSYCVAGIGCALAAFCYAEFASMAPVAGSAYTYAYATLGELMAWIIGWDLILEYAMSCATVAASWSKYLNEFLRIVTKSFLGKEWVVPDYLCHDPFSHPGAWFNLPAVAILALVTVVLVIGIRESAASNTVLVLVKLGVVFFVIAMGAGYVAKSNWFDIPAAERKMPEQVLIKEMAEKVAKSEHEILEAAGTLMAERYGTKPDPTAPDKQKLVAAATKVIVDAEGGQRVQLDVNGQDLETRVVRLSEQALAIYMRARIRTVTEELQKEGIITAADAPNRIAKGDAAIQERLDKIAKEKKIDLAPSPEDIVRAEAVLARARDKAPETVAAKWGLLGYFGLNKSLEKIDNSTRSNYMPYGLSGVMLGAALVFFAFIGFDSISTHAEEAIRPQRDVPFGIIASLFLCTILYIAVSSVITGMQPYPDIDTDAAIASAFRLRAEAEGGSSLLKASAGLIAAGGLAGMTSVLLITFLSQARIFLAMARDRLLPPAIFGVVHHKFKTPHVSTIITGVAICIVAAFTPILVLEEMVNIGTLFAFIVVCAAVLLLRVRRPEVKRPFRCPFVFVVAPLGILVNVAMALFLPIDTWLRLVVWLFIGLIFYIGYGYRNSRLGALIAAGKA